MIVSWYGRCDAARRRGGGGDVLFFSRRRGAGLCLFSFQKNQNYLVSWAEAHEKIARMTLTIKLDRNWSSFQLANSAPPLSVTDSAIAPSARMQDCGVALLPAIICNGGPRFAPRLWLCAQARAHEARSRFGATPPAGNDCDRCLAGRPCHQKLCHRLKTVWRRTVCGIVARKPRREAAKMETTLPPRASCWIFAQR